MGISTAYVNPTHKIVTTKTNKLDYKNSSELRFRAGKFKINNKTIRINPSDNLQKIVNKINKAKIPGIKKAELKPNGIKIICTTPKVKIDDNKNLVLLNLLQKRMIGCNNNQLIQFVKETRLEGTNDHVKIKFEFPSNPDEHKVNLDKLFAKEAEAPPKEQKFPYHLFIDIFNDNKTESDLATDDLSTEVDNNYQPFIFGVPVKDDINIKADIDDKNNFTIWEESKLDSPNSHSPLNTPIDQEQERGNLIFNNWIDNPYYNQQKDDNNITNNNQSNNKITSRRNSLSINNIISFNELQEEYNKLLVKRQNITDKIIDTEEAFVNENTKYRKLNSASSICKLDLSNMDSMYKKLTNLLLKTQIAVNSLDGNIDEWQHDIRDLVNVELKEVIKCFNEHNDLSQKYNYNDSYKNLVAIDNKMKAPNRESLGKMHQLFLDFPKAIELCKEEIESYSNQLKAKALDINDINNDIICYEESLSAINDNLISLNKAMSELTGRFKK